MAVLPAAFTDRRRVDDRHHLTDVFLEETIKEYLVAILQGREEHVALEIALFSPIVFVSASELLLNCRTVQWQQSQQPKLAALSFGKCTAFVKQGTVQ